jgi:hypothetical protein
MDHMRNICKWNQDIMDINKTQTIIIRNMAFVFAYSTKEKTNKLKNVQSSE